MASRNDIPFPRFHGPIWASVESVSTIHPIRGRGRRGRQRFPPSVYYRIPRRVKRDRSYAGLINS